MKPNSNNTSIERQKILEGMDKVYEKLIEFKKRMNSELVIIKKGKIVKVKPWNSVFRLGFNLKLK